MRERWRYVCPECGSTDIHTRVMADPMYRCENPNCPGRADGTCYTFDRPIDKKTGERRRRFK